MRPAFDEAEIRTAERAVEVTVKRQLVGDIALPHQIITPLRDSLPQERSFRSTGHARRAGVHCDDSLLLQPLIIKDQMHPACHLRTRRCIVHNCESGNCSGYCCCNSLRTDWAVGPGSSTVTPVRHDHPHNPTGGECMEELSKNPGPLARVIDRVNGWGAGPNPLRGEPDAAGRVAGFWLGVWHGAIAPVTLIKALFVGRRLCVRAAQHRERVRGRLPPGRAALGRRRPGRRPAPPLGAATRCSRKMMPGARHRSESGRPVPVGGF